ncbi:MAG: Hsp20/alpha crystallin family protein [Bacteriovoracaceae bacterium]
MLFKDLMKKNKSENNKSTYECQIFEPGVDIFENQSEIILYADIPGIDKKNVNVTLENSLLKIDAKVDSDEYGNLKPLYTEYQIGHYHREFKIGESIDRDSIQASVENGVLTLKLKKSLESQPRRITVN